MRKLLLTTAAVAAALCLAGCSKKSALEYVSETQLVAEIDSVTGILSDKRDGKTYRTVIMPDNKRWMAENMNYKTTSGSWCYNDSISYCKKHGRLYTWDAATRACPIGYHLPSREEWDDLGKSLGGKRAIYEEDGIAYVYWLGACKMLKAKSDWDYATDDFGFSALLSGIRTVDGEFSEIVAQTFWWTATEYDDYSYVRHTWFAIDDILEGTIDKNEGLSVRCVADSP